MQKHVKYYAENPLVFILPYFGSIVKNGYFRLFKPDITVDFL